MTNRVRIKSKEAIGQDDHWCVFRQALSDSVQAIEMKYFRLDRYGAPSVWRERIYCYELYHQLRSRLHVNFPYTLHGEIDKRGYEIFRQYFPKTEPNPDFVVHDPGTEKNLVVIEVKPENTSQKRIDKDIEKLRIFTDSVGYQHGILLFFGAQRHWNLKGVNPSTQVLSHEQVGSRPNVVIGNGKEWEF